MFQIIAINKVKQKTETKRFLTRRARNESLVELTQLAKEHGYEFEIQGEDHGHAILVEIWKD